MPRRSKDSTERSSMGLRSPQARKEILREVRTRVESVEDADCETAMEDLHSLMEETDEIHSETNIEDKMCNQEEVLLDSEVMRASSKILKRCTRSLTQSLRSYNPAEFAEKIVQYVSNLPSTETEELNWSLLIPEVTRCFNRTPYYSTLLGALDPLEKKEIVRRKPAVREAQGPVKKPDNVVTVAKEEEGVERNTVMKSFIKQYYKTHKQPLDFFKLILHPLDFGKTIENILLASFLVCDGQVKLSKDESGILIIQPCSKQMTEQAIKAGKSKNIQNIVYLNMNQWKRLKDVYRLEKPLLDFDQGN